MGGRLTWITRSLGVAALLTGTASAQSPIQGVLQGISTTPPQSSVGAVIEIICPPGQGLVADLQARCNEIVLSTVVGQRDVPGSRAGLQAMAPEEDSVVGVTQSDLSAGETDLAARRIDLARSGTAGRSGLTVNGRAVAFDGGQPVGMAAGAGTGPWNLFLDVAYAYSERDATVRQSGFDADTWAVLGGVEYDFSRRGFLGAGLGYSYTDAEIDQNGGSVESGEVQLQLYGTYYLSDRLHLDGTVGYSRADIDQERAVRYSILNVAATGTTTVNQLALSDTDSDTLWASASLGYDIYRGPWTLMPFATLEVARIDIDGFTERMSNPGAAGSGLATQIDDQEITSVPLSLGLQISHTSRTSWGEFTPQLVGEFVYEFDNEQDAITGRFVGDSSGTTFVLPTDKADSTYGRVTVGATLALGDATTGTVAYQGLLGYRDLDVHAFQLSFRHRW